MAKLLLLALVSLFTLTIAATHADAQVVRQRYGDWSYSQANGYHYRYYYYKPTPTYEGYEHHYCVYYVSRPRYVYYYNPVKQTYWGRYDLERPGYSMLAPEDRKGKLDDIPESAFPAPGEMPAIPGSDGSVKMEAISDGVPKE